MRLLERREVEPLLHSCPSGLTEPTAQRRVGEEALDRRSQARGIARRDEETRLAIDHDFGHAADGRRDDREPSRHRLEDRHRKPLRPAGQDEDVGCRQQLENVVALPGELDDGREAEASHLRFHGRTIGAVADNDRLEAPAREPGEGAHERQGVLRGLEPADGENSR
jgi:hypothetical protein